MKRNLFSILIVLLVGISMSSYAFNLAGPQIFNLDYYWQTVHIGDFYGPNFKVNKFKPVELTGCRNGSFSGSVVLASGNGAIVDLKATMSDMVNEDGKKIPASSVQVRFSRLMKKGEGHLPPYRFNSLVAEIEDEIEIVDIRKHRTWEAKKPGPVSMQPVWVTVNVPKDAAPGTYTGKLTVQAESMDPFPVTVKINVHGWTLSDPLHYKVVNPGWCAPDPIASFYKVEKWSDEHFKLMGKSLELMLPLGSRQIVLDLVRKYPSRDNDESMIRWVKQADGSFKQDYTIVDKYFDVAAKAIGKPFPVRINIFYHDAKHTKPAMVTTVDPKTGELGTLETPKPGTPENEAFWKPVLLELRKKIEKRGWWKSTCMNWIRYCGTPEPASITTTVKNIWPDGRWSSMDHGRRYWFPLEGGGKVEVLAHLTVWNEGTLKPYFEWDKKTSPGPRGTRGRLKEGYSFCGHARGQHRDWHPLWVARTIVETMLMKGNHGLDPLGGDYWPMPDRRGRLRSRKWAAYALGPGNSALAYLAPGKDGPVATERYEAFREGVQICEALVYVQRAADSKKLSPKLTAKANKVLDDRARHYVESHISVKKGKGSRQQLDHSLFVKRAFELEDALFAVAGEIEKALGK